MYSRFFGSISRSIVLSLFPNKSLHSVQSLYDLAFRTTYPALYSNAAKFSSFTFVDKLLKETFNELSITLSHRSITEFTKKSLILITPLEEVYNFNKFFTFNFFSLCRTSLTDTNNLSLITFYIGQNELLNCQFEIYPTAHI